MPSTKITSCHSRHNNTDQVGYIKGLNVSSLLRLTDDVIDQLNVSRKPGIKITVHHLHAFGCISKDFMLKAFERFGFGRDFVR